MRTALPLAVLAGLLLFAAAPAPHGQPLLAWIALVPLFVACRRAPPRRALLLGFVCGLTHFLLLLRWITIVLGTYGQLPAWLAGLALLLLAAYMALYTAAFSAVLAWMTRAGLPLLWTAPPLWVALDLIRGRLFTGFPWLDLGYTQYPLPVVIQAADLAGHHGITFLIVLANGLCFALPALLSRRAPRPRSAALSAIAAALLLAIAGGYGTVRLGQTTAAAAAAEHLPVTVVQGNIAQDQKWLPANQRHTVADYLDLTAQALTAKPAGLVVWPETALPFYPLEHPLFTAIAEQVVARSQACLLTGAPHRRQDPTTGRLSYFNSAFLLTPGNEAGKETVRLAGRYDKQHLVPFGEYIPFRRLLPMVAPVVETMGDFSAGGSGRPLPCGDVRIGVLICFESIFPGLARAETAAGADVLVNITNDAWFGRSNAPWQHLAMAVLRAVENRRSLARAANTGISGFVEPSGRVVAATPLFEAISRTASLPLLHGRTVFDRFGHWFAGLCLASLLPLALWSGSRKRRTDAS